MSTYVASSDNSTQLIREAMVRTAGANDGTAPGLPSKWDTIEDLSKIDQLDSSFDGDEIDTKSEGAIERKTSPVKRYASPLLCQIDEFSVNIN